MRFGSRRHPSSRGLKRDSLDIAVLSPGYPTWGVLTPVKGRALVPEAPNHPQRGG